MPVRESERVSEWVNSKERAIPSFLTSAEVTHSRGTLLRTNAIELPTYLMGILPGSYHGVGTIDQWSYI